MPRRYASVVTTGDLDYTPLVGARAMLYLCPECAAAVEDTAAHNQWHINLNRRLAVDP